MNRGSLLRGRGRSILLEDLGIHCFGLFQARRVKACNFGHQVISDSNHV